MAESEWLRDPGAPGSLVHGPDDALQAEDPRRKRRWKVTVPDVLGKLFPQAWESLMLANLRVEVDRLEPDPAPEAGIVVEQEPSPGTVVPAKTIVRVSVLHPAAARALADRRGASPPTTDR